jgi:ascorbate PTS system EIIB component
VSRKGIDEPIRAIAVCGVGMGSSLMLRMTAEKAFAELGVKARVEATDLSSAKSMEADVVLGQDMHTDQFVGKAPIVISVSNFMDSEGLKRKLEGALREQGWLE